MCRRWLPCFVSLLCLLLGSAPVYAAGSALIPFPASAYQLDLDECLVKYQITVIPACYFVPTEFLEDTVSYTHYIEEAFGKKFQEKISMGIPLQMMTSKEIFALIAFTASKEEAVELFQSYRGHVVCAIYEDESFSAYAVSDSSRVPSPRKPIAELPVHKQLSLVSLCQAYPKASPSQNESTDFQKGGFL